MYDSKSDEFKILNPEFIPLKILNEED